MERNYNRNYSSDRSKSTKPFLRQLFAAVVSVFTNENEYLESCSLGVDFLSTPRTTTSEPRTPTAAFPLRTASRAYSTWNKCPSGENTVIARSYLAILFFFFGFLFSASASGLALAFCFCLCCLQSGREGRRRFGQIRIISFAARH